MVRIALVLTTLAGAATIGITQGWRWVLAPLLSLALFRWSFASLRVLVSDGSAAEVGADPVVSDGPERTLFWCEECGTEVMLVARGTERAPTHCGQRMHERTELLG